ncbi:MAG: hypothetical protein K5839_04010 [Treponemataceae bacterium]|nr:hypothetical protein [Treponemataceae bacterium]
MKVTKKVILLIAIELALSFAVCIGFGFIFYKAPELEISSKASWKFFSSLLLFFKLLPAILASGILIGYSWAFGRQKVVFKGRFSAQAGKYYVHILLVSLCCTVMCFIATETAGPLLKNHMSGIKEKSQNISEYISLAEISYKEGDFGSSLFYINSALEINPKHKTAALFKTKIETELSEQDVNKRNFFEEYVPEKHEVVSSTIPDLMKEASYYFAREDYLNAHYYASLVLEIAPSKDGNRIKAKQIASEAWSKISETKSYDNDLSKEIFEEKKDAYSSLMNGDYSQAYYSFYDLLQRYPRDTDIQKYFAQARKMIQERYFFIDETENLHQFEQFRNVFFSLDSLDGGKEIISIAGITSVKATERMIMYLRNFSIVAYDENNELKYKMTVPYAKMVSSPLESVSPEMQTFISQEYKTQYVPYVLLKSIDREFQFATIEPEFICYNDYKPEFKSVYVMPISFEQFSTLCDVSKGRETMNILPLINFESIADKFGYSRELFSQSLLTRIAYPLVILICYIFCGILAWQYRLFSNESFKLIWLSMFPFIIGVAFLILQFVLYFAGLFYFALFGISGEYSILIAIAILIVITIIMSVRFCSVKQ